MGSPLDLLASARCAGCRHPGSPLCSRCASALRTAPAGETCEVLGGADRVLAAWAYEGAARSLVLDLKLSGSEPAAAALASGIVRLVRSHGVLGEVITWVPAPRRDRRRRGFDHAELIARWVGRSIGIPVVPLLGRSHQVRDSVGLTRIQRAQNLEGAFSARLTGARVILVDDLVTTGATARSCTSALRSAGAAGVEVLVACRA